MRNLSWQHIVLIIIIAIIVFWFLSWLLFPKTIPQSTGPYYQPQIIQPMTILPQNNNNIPPQYAFGVVSNDNNAQNANTADVQNAANDPFVLYYFHSPTCGHCKNFNPAWELLRQKLSGSRGVSTRAIDTTNPENENLAFYYNVSAVPTIILITPDRNVEYSGNRNPDDLHNFVVAHINDHNNRNRS
ncbi:thioredoxin [Saudi moumouvirus]|nr:thioredoxin [Saudi moumouvirus]